MTTTRPAPSITTLTPVTRDSYGGRKVAVKRDDEFGLNVPGLGTVKGGKVRTCLALCAVAAERGPIQGLITAGSRSSPQVNIVAHVARHYGVPCRVHVPRGDLLPEVERAVVAGAEVIAHGAGYNSVITTRARQDAAAHPGWVHIPFGMECEAAVVQTAGQVANLPSETGRIVVPIGSGMSAAGILRGLLQRFGAPPLVVGVCVGARPERRLAHYAPAGWENYMMLVNSSLSYGDRPIAAKLDSGLGLDPIYEAKCLPFLRAGDLFWIVGIRQTADPGGME